MLFRQAIVLAVASYAATVATATAQPARPYADHPHMWGDWGWGGMILGPIMMIVFIAAAVAVVVLVLRALGVGTAGPPSRDRRTARDILDDRFAQGEIDKAEYEERKRILLD